LTVLAVNVPDPTGYGRILTDEQGMVIGIVEEADASEQQKRITSVNSGIYCVGKEFLKEAIAKVEPDNVQQEFYLTDIIEIGYKGGKRIGVTIGKDYEEVIGVNSRRDLEIAAQVVSRRMGKIS
jgi:bifunctional N-acetylglucosamine-1-phosphate-uridyltransferase/glucosamine-1-phosphate-acetyltransferase GlmU-like protein